MTVSVVFNQEESNESSHLNPDVEDRDTIPPVREEIPCTSTKLMLEQQTLILNELREGKNSRLCTTLSLLKH